MLKGIVRRYIKVYEKDIALRVYSFIASEKYFLKEAAAVYLQEQKKIYSQAKTLFTAFKAANKVDVNMDAERDSFWFAHAVSFYTQDYLLGVKNTPAGGRAPGLLQLAEIDAHIEWFCTKIGASE